MRLAMCYAIALLCAGVFLIAVVAVLLVVRTNIDRERFIHVYDRLRWKIRILDYYFKVKGP